jgi:hypothetical protein
MKSEQRPLTGHLLPGDPGTFSMASTAFSSKKLPPLHGLFDALRVCLRFLRQFLIDARLAYGIGAGRVC